MTTAFLEDLSAKAEKYSVIVNNSDEIHEFTDALQDLSRISGAPSYILLLYLMSNQEKLQISESDLNGIIKTLITFFVRRNVTDVPNTRKLTQMFMDIITVIKTLSGAAVVTEICKSCNLYLRRIPCLKKNCVVPYTTRIRKLPDLSCAASKQRIRPEKSMLIFGLVIPVRSTCGRLSIFFPKVKIYQLHGCR